jgi:hypothetical protein
MAQHEESLNGRGLKMLLLVATRQRKSRVLVEDAHFFNPKPRFIGFEVGSEQRGRWYILYGESNSLGRGVEALVCDPTVALLAAAGK